MASVVWATGTAFPKSQAAETPVWRAFGLLRQRRFDSARSGFFCMSARSCDRVCDRQFPDAGECAGHQRPEMRANSCHSTGEARWLAGSSEPIFCVFFLRERCLRAPPPHCDPASRYAGDNHRRAFRLVRCLRWPLQFDHVPDDFALASEGLGAAPTRGSGIICVAITGGAIVPLITGQAADAAGPPRCAGLCRPPAMRVSSPLAFMPAAA